MVTMSHDGRDQLLNGFAGAGAGAIAAAFVCPLDVVKTRLQVHKSPVVEGQGGVVVRSLAAILKNEGIRGMYRGLSPTIFALLPNWAVYFTTYEQMKKVLHSKEDTGHQLSAAKHMVAAVVAGSATNIATNPLWVVKTRLQTQEAKTGVVPYRGTLSSLYRIGAEEGFRGLYSGLVPALAGVSHVAVQFPVYERIKEKMADRVGKSPEQCSSMEVAIASGSSKIVASTVTYPHEVVRSRLQEQGTSANRRYSGVIDCIQKIWTQERLAGFYRGCATNLMRTTPAAIITFTSFEFLKRKLDHLFPPYPQASSASSTNRDSSQGRDPHSSSHYNTVPAASKEEPSQLGLLLEMRRQGRVPLSLSQHLAGQALVQWRGVSVLDRHR